MAEVAPEGRSCVVDPYVLAEALGAWNVADPRTGDACSARDLADRMIAAFLAARAVECRVEAGEVQVSCNAGPDAQWRRDRELLVAEFGHDWPPPWVNVVIALEHKDDNETTPEWSDRLLSVLQASP